LSKLERDIEPALLRRLLRYEPETGKLYWLARTSDLFANGVGNHDQRANCNRWNARFAGKEAFISKGLNGYWIGSLFHRKAYAHRVIWQLVTGESPLCIDHINGDGFDNRWTNLRSVTRRLNQMNQRKRCDNSTGQTGVGWCRERELWIAFITTSGKKRHLGRFAVKADAIVARRAAERRLGFHPNHGRAA